MSHFIEVHLVSTSEDESQSCILNVDSIAYLTPYEGGSLLRLSSVITVSNQGRVESHLSSIHVMENYYTLKELLQCQ